jgi:hypothetical protein
VALQPTLRMFQGGGGGPAAWRLDWARLNLRGWTGEPPPSPPSPSNITRAQECTPAAVKCVQSFRGLRNAARELNKVGQPRSGAAFRYRAALGLALEAVSSCCRGSPHKLSALRLLGQRGSAHVVPHIHRARLMGGPARSAHKYPILLLILLIRILILILKSRAAFRDTHS